MSNTVLHFTDSISILLFMCCGPPVSMSLVDVCPPRTYVQDVRWPHVVGRKYRTQSADNNYGQHGAISDGLGEFKNGNLIQIIN